MGTLLYSPSCIKSVSSLQDLVLARCIILKFVLEQLQVDRSTNFESVGVLILIKSHPYK
jgi:hypothetical protein